MKSYDRRIVSLMVLWLSSLSHSYEYMVESEISLNAQHDDNINLEVENTDSLYGQVVNPSANIKINSENLSSNINVDLKFSDFNREGYDSDDQYLTYQLERRGERSTAGFYAAATHDTTRTSEGEDSGRYSNARRKLYSFAPSWTYYANSRNLLTIQLNFSSADYDDLRYVGYQYADSYAEWAYIVDEKLRLFLRANGSIYESDERTQFSQFSGLEFGIIPVSLLLEQSYTTSTDSIGFQFGGSYQITEKINVFGLIGRSDTTTEYEVDTQANQCENPFWLIRGLCDLQDDEATTKNTELSASWEEERFYLNLMYSVKTQPSSDGYVLEHERLKFKWKYRLSVLSSIGLDATWGENQALDLQTSDIQARRSNRDYLTVIASYSHRIKESWSVNASVRYRRQEREINPDEAEGWGGQIGISYYPKTLQW